MRPIAPPPASFEPEGTRAPRHAAMRFSAGTRLTLIGLSANAALAFIKLIAGLTGYSYALIADAVESLADTFGSMVVWRGLHVSSRPADANHPYGHGRAEALAALIVGMMLLAAAIGIAIQAIREIITPHHAPAPFTLWVLVGVVIVKEALFRVLNRAAESLRSDAVHADAWHHRSDAITSLAAALGIGIAWWGGPAYAPADDWAALVAAGVIAFNAAGLIRMPMHELSDGDVPEIAAGARSIAREVAGVCGVEKAFARKLGAEYWIEMHLEVDPDLTVRDGHALAHRVEAEILARMPTVRDVLMHVEPFGRQRSGSAMGTSRLSGPQS